MHKQAKTMLGFYFWVRTEKTKDKSWKKGN